MVDIGKCSLDLPWTSYYEKELDVRFSRSYGPGRYDPLYEIEGIDYPAGYVRWTERRNLAASSTSSQPAISTRSRWYRGRFPLQKRRLYTNASGPGIFAVSVFCSSTTTVKTK